jgi:UDP-galactopyranose mutase
MPRLAVRADWSSGKIDPAELPQALNISYPGYKQYQDLPLYLAHFDVAILPFTLSEATRYISPTKTLEYLAARKPIVSTPIHDVVELYEQVVYVAHSYKAFLQKIEDALQRNEYPDRRRREDRLLNDYAWDSIVEQMNEIIETHVSALALSHTSIVEQLGA